MKSFDWTRKALLFLDVMDVSVYERGLKFKKKFLNSFSFEHHKVEINQNTYVWISFHFIEAETQNQFFLDFLIKKK